MTTKILITGGAGFIGQNLSIYMRDSDLDFAVVDRSQKNVNSLIEQFGDDDEDIFCMDTSDALKWIEDGRFDVVVHLSAVPRVPYSIEHPVETTQENIVKTVELLEACVKGKVKRFVFASSSSVYGNSDVLPVTEDLPLNPISPYALQKKTAEDFCSLYSNLYDIDTVCLRFFTVYGPLQTGDNPYATVICAWLDAVKNKTELKLYGDGSQSRDFCYIDNVVDAIVKSIYHEGKFMGESFNVSCGETTSCVEILDWFIQRYHLDKSCYTKYPFRAGDVRCTYGSIDKIKKVLNYSPQVDIWKGLEMTAEWYESQK
jgi:nucleoside-diphosphate-sugar epimerase